MNEDHGLSSLREIRSFPTCQNSSGFYSLTKSFEGWLFWESDKWELFV